MARLPPRKIPFTPWLARLQSNPSAAGRGGGGLTVGYNACRLKTHEPNGFARPDRSRDRNSYSSTSDNTTEIVEMPCRSSRVTASLFSTLLVMAGIASADDDKKLVLEGLMEKVGRKEHGHQEGRREYAAEPGTKLTRRLWANSLMSLAKIGKQIHDNTEPAKKEKKWQKDWTTAVDDFVASAENLSKEVTGHAKHEVVKKAFLSLQTRRANCHNDFKKD